MFSLIVVVSQCLQDLAPFILQSFSLSSGIVLIPFAIVRPHTHFGSITGTQLALLLFIIAIFVFTVYHIVMPLPPGIADRKKLIFWEISLRFSFGYLGDLVEWLGSARSRNNLARGISSVAYTVRPVPKWCDVRSELIGGVKCRIYTPRGSHLKSHAVIIYMHGGGWCILKPKSYDGPIFALLTRSGCVVVSVDYRRAPEATFPAAIDDCEAVVHAVYEERHKELGVDRNRIAIMGDSAGGNLAAVVCQRLLRQQKPYPRCQVLINPLTHALDFRSHSYQDYHRHYSGTALLSPTVLARWYLLYLGIDASPKNVQSMTENGHLSANSAEILKLVGTNKEQSFTEEDRNARKGSKSKQNDELVAQFSKFLTPDLCPLLGDDLQGLPPAFIATMGVDVVRDEGIDYVHRLRSFGVPTIWHHYEAAYHGIIHMAGSKLRSRLLDDVAKYLQRHLS
ncbi:Protein F16F9.4 [Aphelenchoides avenae]|nr:Protein F16F9.4 [Aphelenchus avenae]